MEASKSYQLTKEEIQSLMARKPFLSKQSFDDLQDLNILSHKVISRQPTLNIGNSHQELV